MPWSQFIRWVMFAVVAFGGILYGAILILDPYQNVPFSPSLNRAPVSTNQRFAYPALARDPIFDSAIIGTSTTRLLDPARLSSFLDARFVNLSMNSATAYEQTQIFELFIRNHPNIRYMVFGIDETWCNRSAIIEKYTFRSFPEWMYDSNRWNDLLYLFNDKALENAVRMLELLSGRREPKYRVDGYRNFTGDFGPYDLEAVRKRLHAVPPTSFDGMSLGPSLTQFSWHYPLIITISRLLAELPDDTRVLLLFPPLHARYIARRAADLSECKGRIAELLPSLDNVVVMDFLHISELTRDDSNYWDPIHFTSEIAKMLEINIAQVLGGGEPESSFATDFETYGATLP